MSLNCPNCGLPKFDGADGYVGPKCMCLYRQSGITHFADYATLARIAELERENAELRKDAERYRWLRDNSVYEVDESDSSPQLMHRDDWRFHADWEQRLDAAIDAAIGRRHRQRKGE